MWRWSFHLLRYLWVRCSCCKRFWTWKWGGIEVAVPVDVFGGTGDVPAADVPNGEFGNDVEVGGDETGGDEIGGDEGSGKEVEGGADGAGALVGEGLGSDDGRGEGDGLVGIGAGEGEGLVGVGEGEGEGLVGVGEGEGSCLLEGGGVGPAGDAAEPPPPCRWIRELLPVSLATTDTQARAKAANP